MALICITGDVHGDINRFRNHNLWRLKKNECLIVCGDFGFLWNGGKREQRILKRLGRKRYHILFVDGCHENYDLLKTYPVGDWNGGKVRVISGRLMQLMRGEVYEIDGRKVFAFGGGQTVDVDIRSSADKWWEDELPTQEEIMNGVRNLEMNDFTVDIVVTHEPPGSLKAFLDFEPDQTSEMHAFFDKIKAECTYKSWYFGKLHKNKVIPPKYFGVFNDVIKIK